MDRRTFLGNASATALVLGQTPLRALAAEPGSGPLLLNRIGITWVDADCLSEFECSQLGLAHLNSNLSLFHCNDIAERR